MEPLATIVPVDPSASEAVVEQKVIQPLLQVLGYRPDNIVPKYPVPFQQGRKSGRKPEADFVVFSGHPHDRNSALIVVEAKRASEDISKARAQAESYASALRAPFILLTNGLRLEVWRLRPTMENEEICSLEIRDLPLKFAQIESCLGVEAILDYASKLERDVAFSPLNVFHKYADLQLQRMGEAGGVVGRRLAKVTEVKNADVLVDVEILSERKGAIIIASSGMGKTVLGYRLLRHLLQQHLKTGGEVIPFHINLVDMGQESLPEYVLATIRAAHPGLTMHSLESLFRERATTIICDTFDQVFEQEIITAEFRKILSRYPKLRLIVLSRRSSAPEVDLPIYEILPLNTDEQYEMAGDMWRVLYEIPNTAKCLCESPLLLSLLIQYRRTHDRIPKDLVQLFQTWLDRIFRAQPTRPSERENLLRVMIALAQVRGQLSISIAHTLLQSIGLSFNYIDKLVQRDAIEVRSRMVSFCHDSLRDYLRALAISEMNLESAKQAIETADLTADSLFPILLMNLSHDPHLRAILWKRLGATSLETVHSVIAFNSADWSKLGLDPSKLQEFLTGIADGVELMVESFFPQLRSAIMRRIAWDHTQHICVAGEADSEAYTVSFLPADEGDPRTMIVPQEWFRTYHGGWSGGGGPIDWMRGCTLGVIKIERAVIELVERNRLSGGPRWRIEKVRGWLCVLRKNGSYFDVPNTTDVMVLAESLERHTGKNFSYHGFGGSVSTEDVVDIIEGLRELKKLGIDHVPESDMPASEWNIKALPYEKVADIVTTIFTEAQHFYREVVDHNFSSICSEMRHYNLFPARLQVKIERILDDWHIQTHWKAASNWSECGVDIISEASGRFDDIDALFSEMEQSYSKIGKTRASQFLYCTGWGGVYSAARSSRQHRHESIVARVAGRWLEDDLKRIFKL